MPPNQSWTQINKSQIKLNTQGTEWKNLMNECLIKTDIFKENESKFKCPPLDPNMVMNARHEIARNQDFSKHFPLPKEKIKTEAAKFLREENHKKLLNKKAEKLITKEIEKLKGILENHRLISQKFVEEKPKTSTTVQRHEKLQRRFQACGGICEVDIWRSKFVQMTMETKISDSGIPLDVKVRVKRKEKKEEEEEEETRWSEPVSSRKGSLVEEEDSRECMKSEMKLGFSEEKEGTEECCVEKEFERAYDVRKLLSARKEVTNQRKMQLAWKVWRIYTVNNRKRKQEKAIYENKIEAFFSKLQEKIKETRERPKSYPSRKPNIVERAKTAVTLSEQQRQRNQLKTEEKAQKLRELVKDIKASQKEAVERLTSFNKQKPAEFNKKESPELNFLLRMKNRREDRNNRWREIREKKLKLKEEKEKEEKKKKEEMKAQEEKEKKRKVEELKEKRRLDREKIEEAKRASEKLKAQLIQAENHYMKLLLTTYGLRPWLRILKLRQLQEERAETLWEERLQSRAFGEWRAKARKAVKAKEEKADKMLVGRHLKSWAGVLRKRMRQWQVAVDWDELRLSERIFRWWMKFTQEEQLKGQEMKDAAILHNQMKIKLKYLKIWQNYPEFKRLEAARENRKRIWRQRVLEIIPDYKPIKVSDKS